jgi:hypothetical protein
VSWFVNGSRRAQGGCNDDSSSNRTRILDWLKCWPSPRNTHLGKTGDVIGANDLNRRVWRQAARSPLCGLSVASQCGEHETSISRHHHSAVQSGRRLIGSDAVTGAQCADCAGWRYFMTIAQRAERLAANLLADRERQRDVAAGLVRKK